jgi:hypothetical protein
MINVSGSGTDLAARASAATAQDDVDSILRRTFTEVWPVSTDLRAAGDTTLDGTTCGWVSRITSIGAGAPTVYEIDSNGKYHATYAASTATGSGNLKTIDDGEKGPEIVSVWHDTYLPSSGYVEIETILTLDSGESNQVSTSNAIVAGLILRLIPLLPTQRGTTGVHNIQAVVSFATGAVNIYLKNTVTGSTSNTITVSAPGYNLVTGVKLKLRISSIGTVTMYTAEVGSAYSLASGSIKVRNFKFGQWGVFSANNSATTGAGGPMNIRLTPPTLTRVP